MTTNIARHDFPENNENQMQAERLSESVIKDIDEIEESSDLIDFTFTTSLLALRAHCLVDPRAAAVETWEAAVNAMQLGSALYAATNASEGTVECRINRKMRVIPTIEPLPSADAGNWLTAFWLAIICRDQARMTQLCEIPPARLSELPTETPIGQVLEASAEKRFSGFYRDPANPSTFKQVDFTGGTIKPVYKLQDGNYVLHTMFANPTPGRHPQRGQKWTKNLQVS
ncbi:immunity 49 family protein [Streptomyces halstedii]|uniref:immunity 49 family protein n=1 Tax=Streptomyces halstedii TaxID=1944 RepID=UPI0038215379